MDGSVISDKGKWRYTTKDKEIGIRVLGFLSYVEHINAQRNRRPRLEKGSIGIHNRSIFKHVPPATQEM